MKKITIILLTILIALPAYAAQVTLAWDANSPAPEVYRIYQRGPGDSYDYTTPAWAGTGTQATITVQPGVLCFFVARAFSGASVSANSNEVQYYPPYHTPYPTPTVEPEPTQSPTATPTPTPAPPRGFVLLKDGAAIGSLTSGKYSILDGGKLWIVDVSEDIEPAYSGNILSKTLHKKGCRYFGCLTCTAKFSTREDAIAAGYKPCGSCKP